MNVGPLLWKCNEYHYPLDGDETIDKNVNVSAGQKWGDFFWKLFQMTKFFPLKLYKAKMYQKIASI